MNNGQLLDVLTREGVLIDVSVRYWRATKKLNPEDLGLDRSQVTERLIRLGHKKLLPQEALQPFALIEGRAHALIETTTFPFLNGLSHFLPNAKLQEVTGRLVELEQEFTDTTSSFLGRYAEMRQQAAAEWQLTAAHLVQDPERLVASIEAAFPDGNKMQRFFGFTTRLFQLRVPEKLDMALVAVGEQEQVLRAREQAAQAAADQIHREVEGFVGDCVATLREQTAQLCEEMLESMRSGKTGVHQKTLNRLVRFVEEFKTLNFVGDREMEAQLERVRQEFLTRTAEEYRDNEVAREGLQQGLRGLADMARQLATQDAQELVERFGQLGQRKFHLAA